MNVKHWALFFLVTLSANYVSATFLPFLGGRHRTRERGSGVRWNNCNKRLYGFLRTNIDVFSRTFQSKYGGRCNLGESESDEYTLTNVKAKGFADFTFGDTCRYYVRDGRGSLSFAISFEKIVASFVLGFPGAAGGIIGDFAEAIFGIIGHFVDKLLQIIFPSFLCDIVLEVDYKEGFRLSQFNVRRPEGGLRFFGGLAEHGDILSSYLFDILFSLINKFLLGHLQPFFESGIGEWKYDAELLAELGLRLEGESDGGIALGGSGKDMDLGDDESGLGGDGKSRKGRKSGRRDGGSGGEELGGGGNKKLRRGRKSGRKDGGSGEEELGGGGQRKSRKGSKESGLGGDGKSRKGRKELGGGGDGKSRRGSRESRKGNMESGTGGHRKSGKGNRDSGNEGYKESRWGNKESGDGRYEKSGSGNGESGDGEYEEPGDLESSSSYSSEYSYTYNSEDDEVDYEKDEEEYED